MFHFLISQKSQQISYFKPHGTITKPCVKPKLCNQSNKILNPYLNIFINRPIFLKQINQSRQLSTSSGKKIPKAKISSKTDSASKCRQLLSTMELSLKPCPLCNFLGLMALNIVTTMYLKMVTLRLSTQCLRITVKRIYIFSKKCQRQTTQV